MNVANCFFSHELTNLLFSCLLSPAPCEVHGCDAPHNIGCKDMKGEAVCICPECDEDVPPVPVCSSDGVQDRSKCMVKRQSCLVGKEIEIAQENPCGRFPVGWCWFFPLLVGV